MPSLSVGGVTILVAPGGISRERLDGVDRARAFDQTYRASVTGTPKRDFHFSTPPLTTANAQAYETILGAVLPQACSGDLIGNASNMVTYSEALDSWTPRGTATVTPNAAIAPDGTMTADQFNPVAASGFIVGNTITGDPNGRTFTAAVWLQSPPGTHSVKFGILKNGDVFEGVDSTVVADATWQRFSITATGTVAGTSFYFFIQEAGGVTNPFNVWGAQLQEASTLGPYTKTVASTAATTTVSCCPEIMGWTPVRLASGHRVVLDFVLHEV